MDFDYTEYQKHLANSTLITDCEKVPVPECAEHQNYIFISYSHRDYKKVYHDLAYMYQAGVRFWYDEELTAGKDWDDEVFQRINDPHCSGVVFYISDNFFQSQSVYREILTTLGRNKKLAGSDLAKNYFCVNLSTASPAEMIDANFVPDSSIEKDLCEEGALKNLLKDTFRNKKTYISFGSKGYMDKLLVQIRRNFNVIDLTGDDASLVGEYNGEMLNGKRTGYGICKYADGSIYEGEWKENKYHGKGRLTYPEGNHREYLEGIFVEHKANGHCVFKFRNGDCYAGNMTDGKITGHFTYTQKDGYTYVGDMVAGEKHGKGKLTWPEGSEYTYFDGEWLNNTRCGNGVLVYKDGTSWEGIWKHDKAIDGFGTIKYSSGRTYFGNTKNGQCNGKGYLTYAPNEQWEYYEGEFVDGSLSGVGVLKFRNGECYEGEFLGGKYHGKGKLTFKVSATAVSYEGEFLESQYAGKGTMHFRDGSVYSGEWLNCKKHGQGILVCKNGDRWEGIWENGKRHTGCGHYELSKEKQHYNGEMKNGLLHGRGKLTYEETSHVDFYEGDFVKGKKTGKGVMQFRNGAVYSGEWLEGDYSGYGEITEPDGTRYEGYWQKSKKCGHGKYTYSAGSDKEYYDGAWDKGKKNGYGILKLRDGKLYEGEFVNNKYHGKGKLTYEKDSHIDFYDGEWVNDEKTGFGIMQFRSGNCYEGQWLNDKIHGNGVYTFGETSSAASYEGEFAGGKYAGKGTMHFRDGSVYTGEWLNNNYHGQGVLVYKNGDRWEGEWENDKEQNGFGAIQRTNGEVYYGGVENGLYHGKGKLIYAKTSHIDFYEGDFVNGKKTGLGIMKFKGGESYEGQWLDDEYNGHGVFRYKENKSFIEKYEGQWVNSKKSGHGVLTYLGGSYFDGQWKDDLQNGPGTLFRKGVFRRSTLKGVWVNGLYDWTSHKYVAWMYSVMRQQQQYEEQKRMRQNGEEYTDENGVYLGEWKKDVRSGKGTQMFSDGSIYDGEWKNNKFHGLGKYTRKNGSRYEGYWKKHLMNGHGCYHFVNGSSYDGSFKKDRIHGQGTYTDPQNNVLKGVFRQEQLYNGTITLADGRIFTVVRGKIADKTILDWLPEETKAYIAKAKKELFSDV